MARANSRSFDYGSGLRESTSSAQDERFWGAILCVHNLLGFFGGRLRRLLVFVFILAKP